MARVNARFTILLRKLFIYVEHFVKTRRMNIYEENISSFIYLHADDYHYRDGYGEADFFY